jgi:hypothetical protein
MMGPEERTMLDTKERTGRLDGPTNGKLGTFWYFWWRCVDCGTSFPEIPERGPSWNGYDRDRGPIKCNGQVITTCPWCGPDGRGR